MVDVPVVVSDLYSNARADGDKRRRVANITADEKPDQNMF